MSRRDAEDYLNTAAIEAGKPFEPRVFKKQITNNDKVLTQLLFRMLPLFFHSIVIREKAIREARNGASSIASICSRYTRMCDSRPGPSASTETLIGLLDPSPNLMFLSSKEFRKIRPSGRCLDTTQSRERSLLKMVKETNMNQAADEVVPS